MTTSTIAPIDDDDNPNSSNNDENEELATSSVPLNLVSNQISASETTLSP